MGYRTNEERLLSSIDRQARVGECGGVLIDGTTAVTGRFVAFTVIADSTQLDVSGIDSNIDDLDTDTTIPKGVTIFGNFASLQLTGGAIIAYKKCE